jgi:hypothetical protein
VFGHQIGMLPQAIAGAFDLDDHGMVQQPIEQCGGDDGIAKGTPRNTGFERRLRVSGA